MEIPILTDIVIIFGLSIAVLLIFHAIRLPAVVGFFLTGIMAGSHGFGMSKAVHEIEVMAKKDNITNLQQHEQLCTFGQFFWIAVKGKVNLQSYFLTLKQLIVEN